MPRAVSVIASHQFQNSLEQKNAKVQQVRLRGRGEEDGKKKTL